MNTPTTQQLTDLISGKAMPVVHKTTEQDGKVFTHRLMLICSATEFYGLDEESSKAEHDWKAMATWVALQIPESNPLRAGALTKLRAIK